MRALLDHVWPGNVRELRNAIEYAFAVGRGSELLLAELPPELREEPEAPASTRPAHPLVSEPERIRWALERTKGHVGEAAELLGMSRPTFWRKRKKHRI
jgi:transcriptional regulator of acetoin/glycerol metabolism